MLHLVHGSVGWFWVVSLSVGDSETFGALSGPYPGLLLTGVRRCQVRHWDLPEVVDSSRLVRRWDLPEVVDSSLVGCRCVFVLHLLSRGRSGSVQGYRRGLFAPGRPAQSCCQGCLVIGDFRLVRGRRLCLIPRCRFLMCLDLCLLLGCFVGGLLF